MPSVLSRPVIRPSSRYRSIRRQLVPLLALSFRLTLQITQAEDVAEAFFRRRTVDVRLSEHYYDNKKRTTLVSRSMEAIVKNGKQNNP